MRLLWKILAVIGAGTGAGLLVFSLVPKRDTEDETGTTIPPDEFVGPPAPAGQSLGLKAVEALSRYVGAKEEPKGSNRGPVVDQIVTGVTGDGKSLLGKPWCARALRFAYEKAAQELGQPLPFSSIKSKLAAVTDWADTFKGYACDPKPGCAALILDGSHRHATLVSRVDGDTVVTVEGNHSDSVAIVKRQRSAFKHFLDIEAYAKRPTSISGLDLLGTT